MNIFVETLKEWYVFKIKILIKEFSSGSRAISFERECKDYENSYSKISIFNEIQLCSI